ncbi:hypothetical protein DYI22_00690 [Marinobacter lipolyticus]|uniref:general secretion pathway protein GspB n=1 Tax=Marinobacter lipolyticus TaxID=209639 RepID=UPI001BCE4FA3|nr:general secretion pathway protein GspB [Marinobacter lipolyticus]MBS8239018.1 hypothetical protein [Marinobacter lipolyticus]
MSYILDALRKSETERRQGKIPDLGQQVQLIHKPRKKTLPPAVWIAGALLLNAAVLLVVFWPSLAGQAASGPDAAEPTANPPAEAPAPPPVQSSPAEKAGSTADVMPSVEPKPVAVPDPMPRENEPAIVESGDPEPRLRPTIIVPNRPMAAPGPSEPEAFPEQRVPHLVELPVPFQKSIPDLIFNSHIYASEPASRRVMINNQYMRVGDSFSGIRVERITEDGVELSKNGRHFRVGVVRDWMSPR